jgi:transcription antitermination factor NusG
LQTLIDPLSSLTASSAVILENGTAKTLSPSAYKADRCMMTPAMAALWRIGDMTEQHDDFKPDDAVSVVGGAFDSFSGTVTRRDGESVFVRLVMFGGITGPLPFNPVALRHNDPKK